MKDSTQETLEHIATVEGHLSLIADHLDIVARMLMTFSADLRQRGLKHDASKLESPEKEMYDRWTPFLRGLSYTSDEYKAGLAAMGPALQHHYQHNSHHPEHYPDGINDMNLLDIIEMLCDWAAAAKRHADGDLNASIKHNCGRFRIDPQLGLILANTAQDMAWIRPEPL